MPEADQKVKETTVVAESLGSSCLFLVGAEKSRHELAERCCSFLQKSQICQPPQLLGSSALQRLSEQERREEGLAALSTGRPFFSCREYTENESSSAAKLRE